MKHNFFAFVFLFLSVSVFSKDEGKEIKFNETYRPQFHFSPEENRMGSPISIIQSDSVFQLFYQWNPHNLQQGYVNWGYSLSTDLMKWSYEGISINQKNGESDSMNSSPWWGSIVDIGVDRFAYVNSWGDGIYRYNDFNDGKWINPIKTNGTEEFKNGEPYVFWHEKTNKLVMVLYNRADSTVNFLNSPDGLNWNKTSNFHFKFGFVSMIELPVDRKTDETRWLMITETGNYMLGKFDGESFELLSPIRKFDYGKMVGGSICFTDKKQNQTILLSELMSDQHPDLPSNGQLTFPTNITLHEYPTGIELRRLPIDKIKDLYLKTHVWTGKKIYPGINNNILGSIRGETFHLKGVIDLKNCDQFGFIIRNDKNMTGTEINYNVSNGQLSMMGSKFNFKPENNKFEFEILIDRSSIELFVDQGRYVISSTFVPDIKSQRYTLYTIGGEIMVDQMEANQLKSVWSEGK